MPGEPVSLFMTKVDVHQEQFMIGATINDARTAVFPIDWDSKRNSDAAFRISGACAKVRSSLRVSEAVHTCVKSYS